MSAEALNKIYHDVKDLASLVGVERLLWRARQLYVPGVPRQKIQEYLRSEQTYTLNKPARRRFTRNHTYVAGIDAQCRIPGRYAGYCQAKRRNEVSAHRI